MIKFDKLGPEKILEVYDPKSGMKGILVIDSTARGPGKGGIRMTPTVSKEEVAKLARVMTWKNSLADLPFGGAKSGILANAKEISLEKKEKLVKAFSKALKSLCPDSYIAAPDMNMAEREMEWFVQTNGDKKSCTGKPTSLGGLPHELGSTGIGVGHATLVALKYLDLDPKSITFAVEGFGNVGTFASKFLTGKGAKLVAVSDSQGCIYLKSGLDYKKLMQVKKETGSVINYENAQKQNNITHVQAEVLITAAIPDVIKKSDIDKLKFKLIVEGSNIPMAEELEETLHQKGILIIPDMIANAGGVISSYVEHINGTEQKMFKLVEEKITKNTALILKLAKEKNISPRKAAIELAEERILKAKKANTR